MPHNPGNIVIDVGYGVGGLDILEVINGIDKEQDLNIYIVINTAKPETSTPRILSIYQMELRYWRAPDGKNLAGIISNTHLGDESQKEDAIRGFRITQKAAEILIHL